MIAFRTDDREDHPPHRSPDYRSTRLRAPALPRIPWLQSPTEATGPNFAGDPPATREADLTAQHAGAPLGERIAVTGQLRDEDGRPLAGQLVEIWQANAAGRYAHPVDQHDAPLDPNFSGVGRCLTDAAGRYRFLTIKPGAYPWQNHANAWRPAHLHFSVFGPAFATRLVTQMYFPGDPLLEFDPIFHSVPERARERLIAHFDLAETVADRALGYRFDVVLRGRDATPRGL
ncbi:MAG: protocatechuate 3,4-dioxygenase subunit beta [Myxococcota bacterium]